MIYSYRANLILFLLLSLLLVNCSKNEEQTGMTEVETKLLPDQESWGSTITLTSNGKKMALVRSGHMAQYYKKNLIIIDERMEVDFFDSEEKHTSLLTAESGEIYEKKRDLKAIGNVIVISDSGETLYTEELLWNNNLKKIISEVKVMIIVDSDTLYGVGFESDAGLDNWTIKEPTGKTSRFGDNDE